MYQHLPINSSRALWPHHKETIVNCSVEGRRKQGGKLGDRQTSFSLSAFLQNYKSE